MSGLEETRFSQPLIKIEVSFLRASLLMDVVILDIQICFVSRIILRIVLQRHRTLRNILNTPKIFYYCTLFAISIVSTSYFQLAAVMILLKNFLFEFQVRLDEGKKSSAWKLSHRNSARQGLIDKSKK